MIIRAITGDAPNTFEFWWFFGPYQPFEIVVETVLQELSSTLIGPNCFILNEITASLFREVKTSFSLWLLYSWFLLEVCKRLIVEILTRVHVNPAQTCWIFAESNICFSYGNIVNRFAFVDVNAFI